MFKKPKLKPHFHTEIINPDTVYLLSEPNLALSEHITLRGRPYVQLIPFLNGQNTVKEITQQLKSELSVFTIYNALTRLEDKDCLSEAEDTLPDCESAFWSLLKTNSIEAIHKLQHTTISVISFGNTEQESFIATLKSLKINCIQTQSIPEADLIVVLTDDYLRIELDEFNKQAQAYGKTWLLAKFIGAMIWLGPIFVPGTTGCWECLAQRLRGNRKIENAISQQKKNTPSFPTSRASLPASLKIGENWAAIEIAKWIATKEHKQLEGKILTFDLTSLLINHHTIIKRPQCKVCGNQKITYKEKKIFLENRKKEFIDDGGHRCIAPEQTFKKYEHHIDPITGIISNLDKLNSDNDLIHVYAATHNLGNKLDSIDLLHQNLIYQSTGKGKTKIQSKTSCLCEALERYSGIFTGDEYHETKAFTQMGELAIHPNQCLLYSNTQYQNRDAWNSKHGHFSWVAEPFDEEKEIDWTPVWSLTNQKFKYLPTAFCYYGYPHFSENLFCSGDSNGNASGNTLEEAILQGFMELVERDAVALWWYNRLKRPAVNLKSFKEPYLQKLYDFYRTQDLELWVLDITNDFNIPSFAAISCNAEKTEKNITLGFGTHFDPQIAILRAVTELNQTRLAYATYKGKFDHPDEEYWFTKATLENQPYLLPDSNMKMKEYTDYSFDINSNLKEDVFKCVEIASNLRMETLVLDQTQPDVGLKVVKVIVPGLRHFWSRFAPGRLYEVPVKMGWLKKPLKEADLNPIPMFL